MYISFSQSQIKKNTLPSDTLYMRKKSVLQEVLEHKFSTKAKDPINFNVVLTRLKCWKIVLGTKVKLFKKFRIQSSDTFTNATGYYCCDRLFCVFTPVASKTCSNQVLLSLWYTVGWALFAKFWTIKKLFKPLKDIYPWITKLVSKWL